MKTPKTDGDLLKLMRACFRAGWECSGEGHNAEYPYKPPINPDDLFDMWITSYNVLPENSE